MKLKSLFNPLGDRHLRVKLSLYLSLIFNSAYALLQLGLGIKHHTFWYYSLACYYILLAVMRFFLLKHTRKHAAGEKMLEEFKKYRACGIVFLIMNLAIAIMIFFMVYWNRTFVHHEITAIAMAAYTFTSLTVAIINIVKYRKVGSPVYSAAKATSLASASVSMITLEATMLTAFGDGTMTLPARRILLGVSGGAVSAFIIAMAVYMIASSSKIIKNWSKEMEDKFKFTYSAKQQEEIKAIRKKYVAGDEGEDKMALLRRLDAGVTKKASALSLAFGIVGTLILGFGMSVIMTDIGKIFGFSEIMTMLLGIVCGIFGIVLVCLAYPVYNSTVKKESEKIAPKILMLTDELMK